MPKYCDICGRKNNSKSNFCNSCGAHLSTDGNLKVSGVIQQEHDKSNLKILTALLVFLMPYVGFFYLIIKKPFSRGINAIWAIYCVFICLFVFAIATGKLPNSLFSANTNPQAVIRSDNSNNASPSVSENYVNIGDTIANNSCEIKIKSIDFSYDVIPNNANMFYTHYVADSGHVYIDVIVDVKNIQKQKLDCGSIINVKADYNNGYNYDSFSTVEDGSLGFTYSIISNIDPLDTKTIHYLVDCPQEVAETQNQLFIIFILGGQQYKYIIR